MTTASHKNTAALDQLTGGAFSAPTSGERAARVRAWLDANPSPELMAEVFKELSARDKGAAKPLRERLDDLKRAKGQEALGAEWAAKAEALLGSSKLNIADALAWQRDAQKAGAPLSKEPLASLKARLTERVKVIEDLQHRVQVQREAAVLLAQRIETLSMKPWREAQSTWGGLGTDIGAWQTEATALQADGNWGSVDAKFPPLLQASGSQLLVVWDAFQGALAQAVAASEDAEAPLPAVPAWAAEIRAGRVTEAAAADPAPKPAKPKVDPALREAATLAVREALVKLEAEVAEGHGKASVGAANALRNALREHGRFIGDKLDAQANLALSAATELEGWQRWRADQLREELVVKAEALLKREPGQELGGRKMQEQVRALREAWKQTDQGGTPNHGLWRRFDEACNQAYKVVEAWLEKMKAQSAEHKAQRLALIEEVQAWAADNATAKDEDWKGFARIIHQFSERWREAGHLGEKEFAHIQPLWQAAIHAAALPLEAKQKENLAQRQALIAEAQALGAAPSLRIDAVRALQQRWQHEAQAVPLDRRQEQKLWDAFRKPIDEAFQRKAAEREAAEASLGARDRTVLEASKALAAANASGDVQAIRAAMAALDAALKGQGAPVSVEEKPKTNVDSPQAAPESRADATPMASAAGVAAENTDPATTAAAATMEGTSAAVPATPSAPVPRKPVVAVRGDDRPGQKRAEPAPAVGGKRFGDRGNDRGSDRGSDRGFRRDGDRAAGRDGSRAPAPGRAGMDRGGRFGDAPPQPRLGDAAFRAQREAMESAQQALKKLAARAHGEALVGLMTAWASRDGSQVPPIGELGKSLTAAQRNTWVSAISGSADNRAGTDAAPAAATALLRLEMASSAPTPAAHIEERRALQLQLLTRRNDPTPSQTWAQDVAKVLAGPHAEESARRLQNALKLLLRD